MVWVAGYAIQPAGYTSLVRFVMVASWQKFVGCRFRCFSESRCFYVCFSCLLLLYGVHLVAAIVLDDAAPIGGVNVAAAIGVPGSGASQIEVGAPPSEMNAALPEIVDLQVWLPTSNGMVRLCFPRPFDLVGSTNPLADLVCAVKSQAPALVSKTIVSFGRYHCFALSSPLGFDLFVDSDAGAATLLTDPTPYNCQLAFRSEWVPNPIGVQFRGNMNPELRAVVQSAPRSISTNVLRL